MEERTRRILSIGAHPDDADTSPGGLLFKLYRQGWEVRLLSITDGSAGMYDLARCGAPLADIRRGEAAASGKLLGGRYDVWDVEDGRLTVTLELRERLIRYIREFRPDIIVTNRPQDYHPDHRNTALLVADASFLLTVPYICSDTPVMETMPVILYWRDGFQRPYPFQADVVVPVDGFEKDHLSLACCHESQYFDWLYWPDRIERKDWPREQQIQALRERFLKGFQRDRNSVLPRLEERYGKAGAEAIRSVELYEVCEFGSPLSDYFRLLLEAATV